MLQERQKGQKPTQVQRRYDANLIIFAHFFVEPSTSTSSTLTTTLRSCNCVVCGLFKPVVNVIKSFFGGKINNPDFPLFLSYKFWLQIILKNGPILVELLYFLENSCCHIFGQILEKVGPLFIPTSGHKAAITIQDFST